MIYRLVTVAILAIGVLASSEAQAQTPPPVGFSLGVNCGNGTAVLAQNGTISCTNTIQNANNANTANTANSAASAAVATQAQSLNPAATISGSQVTGSVNSANYSSNSGYAGSAGSASYAGSAGYASSSGYAGSAGYASSSGYAGQAGYAYDAPSGAVVPQWATCPAGYTFTMLPDFWGGGGAQICLR